MGEQTTLTGLLESLDSSAQGQADSHGSDDQLSIGEVLEVIGERGYGPLVLILALIAALPTGAVPGIPSVCGISIALVSTQLIFGKAHPWLPKRLRRLAIERHRYRQVSRRLIPWTRRIDRLVRPRLTVLVQGASTRLIGLACVALGLCMVPLEILPFAAAAPALGIALMGLGLTGRDGFWVLAGLVPAGLAGYFVYTVLS
ncbi:exopolysaccharide synthesis, exoD [Salinisphaera sp. T5B8]|uniref:exopolysaccharide biosynthesis protein n=1 Tax=unclassified Salinisphaera TaxID=2649847 RepID=UPI00333E8867